jgi:hypothetical protein
MPRAKETHKLRHRWTTTVDRDSRPWLSGLNQREALVPAASFIVSLLVFLTERDHEYAHFHDPHRPIRRLTKGDHWCSDGSSDERVPFGSPTEGSEPTLWLRELVNQRAPASAGWMRSLNAPVVGPSLRRQWRYGNGRGQFRRYFPKRTAQVLLFELNGPAELILWRLRDQIVGVGALMLNVVV